MKKIFPHGGFRTIKFPDIYVRAAGTAGSTFYDNHRFPFSDLDIVIQKGLGLVIAEFKRFSRDETINIIPIQESIFNLFHQQLWFKEIFIIGVEEYHHQETEDQIHVVTWSEIISGKIPILKTPIGMKIRKEDMHLSTVKEFRNKTEYLLDEIFPQPTPNFFQAVF